LRLLITIGAASSLTAAARRLKIDHSTAFRRLAAMERRLGVRFFERARDGYTPTPAGETAIATASHVIEALDELERRLAGQDMRPSGVVRVTTTDTLIELLAPMLAAFRAAHGGITLEIVAANPFFTLTRRDADVLGSLAAGPCPTRANCRVRQLAALSVRRRPGGSRRCAAAVLPGRCRSLSPAGERSHSRNSREPVADYSS
jgi:DNA-binding transcriptional LysR family regulator